jgi:hypothetical protein
MSFVYMVHCWSRVLVFGPKKNDSRRLEEGFMMFDVGLGVEDLFSDDEDFQPPKVISKTNCTTVVHTSQKASTSSGKLNLGLFVKFCL